MDLVWNNWLESNGIIYQVFHHCKLHYCCLNWGWLSLSCINWNTLVPHLLVNFFQQDRNMINICVVTQLEILQYFYICAPTIFNSKISMTDSLHWELPPHFSFCKIFLSVPIWSLFFAGSVSHIKWKRQKLNGFVFWASLSELQVLSGNKYFKAFKSSRNSIWRQETPNMINEFCSFSLWHRQLGK